MRDMMSIIRQAAALGHQTTCPNDTECDGLSDQEVFVAGIILNTALPELFFTVSQDLRSAVKAMESGQFDEGEPDATEPTAEELLRAWFHWWRTSDNAPTKMPDSLHIRTVAFLTAQAVADGRTVRGPADV